MTETTDIARTIRRAPKRLAFRLLSALACIGLIALAATPSIRRGLFNQYTVAIDQPADGVYEIAVRSDAVQNHVFDPPHVRIRVGETVVWHFQDIGDSGKHNVVSIDAPAGSFASPVQLTGTFRHTFTAPGRYRYDCTLHTNMRGFIDVVP